jgi:hypothetical protein
MRSVIEKIGFGMMATAYAGPEVPLQFAKEQISKGGGVALRLFQASSVYEKFAPTPIDTSKLLIAGDGETLSAQLTDDLSCDLSYVDLKDKIYRPDHSHKIGLRNDETLKVERVRD